MKYYTGVGSRKTPSEILDIMSKMARKLDLAGWTLRSGGALGADRAFEAGAMNKQIFFANQATAPAMEIAGRLHPAWHRCGEYARKLHGRNSFQVLGPDLQTPSKFLVCWTPDGCESHSSRQFQTGGTGTAISIASVSGIQIFNLANRASLQRIMNWI